MEKWIYAVQSNCLDPLREKEFNDWYNKIHLPDILEIPGFKRATLYENPQPSEGQGKYLAIYEVETEDIEGTRTVLQKNISKQAEQGRRTELIIVVSRVFYKQITEPLERK